MTYNACVDLLDRNLPSRRDKLAYIDDCGTYTYGELAERVYRFSNVLKGLGLSMETRVLLCLQDGIDFPVAALGAMRAGMVPVMVSTLLRPAEFDFMLRDSRAQVLVVSERLLSSFTSVLESQPFLREVIVSGTPVDGCQSMSALMAQTGRECTPAPTVADDACLWQYSSGSTGNPKGTVHLHGSLARVAQAYGGDVLGLTANDLTFSAAKLFFGYGFGNGLIFPLAVGATSVLMAERPTPEAVFARLLAYRPSVFYGVPTLYSGMLASSGSSRPQDLGLRLCVSAGEALPPHIGEQWRQRFGADILDGLGSTEMLHIFVSNRPGSVRYGTIGSPVPGYQLRLLGDDGMPVARGDVGELHVKGPTSAAGYWNNRPKTQATFLGEWTRTGDRCRQDDDGRFIYCGRSDDMLKVSGIYVSPFEVESVLGCHPAVREVAVVGHADAAGLVKPKAFVVLAAGYEPTAAMAEELKSHARGEMAPHKYPRWIEFLTELPKTATGKIQRFRLRQI